ncbi:Type 1 glutamine amidotransferase-like domain-containing protein [Snodgrassella gandavensis]|uniref:Type 1 glutamine amidotransferase-like domain-containing protein n=1 Tax=Snodgrassella gandavensis TaxID=2946698 RepID=UPI001EF4123D|nr:Type 1 glutamine amidotransferase-like domain-containing protein [Snodgrassella gandavensis]
MKTIFLTSYIAGTTQQLADFIQKNQINSKNVLFIPTAGNVESYTGYIDEGKAALQQLGFQLELLDIASADTQHCHQAFTAAEIICIAGGNTFYLLQQLKRKNLDQLLVHRIAQGCIYIGESAGAIILAADIEYSSMMDDSSLAPELDNYAGLNIIDFYPLPHYIEEPFVDSVQQIYAKYSNRLKLIPFNNQHAIIVNNHDYTVV